MINVLGLRLSPLLVAALAYAAWIVAGWSFKKVLFAWLRHLTRKTETELDDIVIEAANIPITLMIFVWGAAFVSHAILAPMPPSWSHIVIISSKVATILAMILFVDFLLNNLLVAYAPKIEFLRVSHSFSSIIVHVLVMSVGLLILLDSVGISITPLIASLGIGSLAVALALQPTLENVFSGMQILLDRPMLPGHYIKLESGEEGVVEKIGWRSSWVRQLSNNMVIIPNKQLVNARIVNFNMPSKEIGFAVDVGVHYDSDLEKVERVTLDVAGKILASVSGSVENFQPAVRFQKFNSSSIDFVVALRAHDFTDIALIRHEFIKALVKRFGQEGIVLPYPITAINLSQEKASLSASN